MRIDSHHHFWNYSAEQYSWIGDSMSILKRDFGPKDLATLTAANSIDGVVSVQARQTVQETEWLLELASQHEFIRGVVGWVPLADATAAREIERLRASRFLKAVRHVVHDEPDDAFILRPDFNAGVSALAGTSLVYDLLIFAKHLPQTIHFVDQHADQPFVLDHIGKPTIAGEKIDSMWNEHFTALAKREHVSCKFSGVVTEVRDAEWNLDSIRPYWDAAWEAFGPNRLMFGSDWPVCLLRSEYAKWIATVEQLSSELTSSEQRQFWGDTAQRVYNL